MTGDGHDAWSRLWRTGVLHSCARGFSDNYAGEIREFWVRQFQLLYDGAHIVDIGTGNGALPLLAGEVARERGIGFRIHGVDLADIDPPMASGARSSAYQGITFHPRTSATAMPFQAGSVDLMTSQYAFEYMPREAMIAEIDRIMTPRGAVAMVVHSDDSVVSRLAPAQVAACAFLFEGIDLFARIDALLDVLASAHTPRQRAALAHDTRAEAARAAFNSAAQTLMAQVARQPDVDVLARAAAHVRNILAASGPSVPEARRLLDQAHDHFRDERQRLAQLQRAIQSPAARARIVAAFADAGFLAEMAPLDMRPPTPPSPRPGQALVHESTRMGWTLLARRA